MLCVPSRSSVILFHRAVRLFFSCHCRNSFFLFSFMYGRAGKGEKLLLTTHPVLYSSSPHLFNRHNQRPPHCFAGFSLLWTKHQTFFSLLLLCCLFVVQIVTADTKLVDIRFYCYLFFFYPQRYFPSCLGLSFSGFFSSHFQIHFSLPHPFECQTKKNQTGDTKLWELLFATVSLASTRYTICQCSGVVISQLGFAIQIMHQVACTTYLCVCGWVCATSFA